MGRLGRRSEGGYPYPNAPGLFYKKGFLTLPAKKKKFPAKKTKILKEIKNQINRYKIGLIK